MTPPPRDPSSGSSPSGRRPASRPAGSGVPRSGEPRRAASDGTSSGGRTPQRAGTGRPRGASAKPSASSRRTNGTRPTAVRRSAATPRPPARRRRTVRLGHQGVRLRSGLLMVLVLLSLIAGRLVWLQGFQATAYAGQAVEQRMQTTNLLAPRGTITDRNGQALALSVDARAVFAEPRTIARATCRPEATEPCDPRSIARALAPALGLPYAEIRDKLVRPKVSDGVCTPADPSACSGFVYLARGLEPEAANVVRDLRLVGVGVMSEPKRVHPGGDLGANVLGFTSLDDQGDATGAGGVELALDAVLGGKDGRSQAEVDGDGRIIPNGQRTVVDPVPGRDVQLTLDRDLQWYAQDVLLRKVQEANAESGTAVVMDVQSGEVLALASVPTFDADNAGQAPEELRGNRAITDIFEPGSTGKLFTMAAGLERGVVTPESVLTVGPGIRMGGKTFKESSNHTTGRLTATGVLVMSSNLGTIQIAQQVGAGALHEMLRRFALGDKTGLGLPGESRGIVPAPEIWSGSTMGALAIGQSYSVNAVQMASAYATVANDGVRVTPTVLKGTLDRDGDFKAAPAPEQRRVLSADISAQLRGMLEGVTGEGGTAEIAALEGYRVAGKTGTAQRVVDGRYNGYTASFVGFAPADAPRLVVAVSVQDPKNGYYGGAIAGPVFRDVMSYALSNQQVPPTGTPAPRLRLRESDPR